MKITGAKRAERGARLVDSERPAGATAFVRLAPIAIAAAGFLAYANCFQGQFILDDQLAILTNGRIRQLWPLSTFLEDTRPVADFTFAMNYAVSGIDLWGFHAVNLFIHIAAALALFGVIRRTLLTTRFDSEVAKKSLPLAFAIAILWVVHPLTTQAVTYIVQRSEALMALFYLLTLYCVIRGAGSAHRVAWYVVAVFMCALGMGSRAVMVTAPLVILVYDIVFLGGTVRAAVRARWPVYLGMIGSIAILWKVGVIGGLYQKEQGGATTVGFAVAGMTAWQYALTQLGVITHYFRLSIWPHPLCIDYGWPLARTAGAIFPGAIVIGAILLGTAWAFWRRQALGFLGFAFFAILAPTSSIIPIRDIAFEHRMYLPLAAVITAVVAGVHHLIARGIFKARLSPVGDSGRRSTGAERRRGAGAIDQRVMRRILGGGLLVIAVLVLGIVTFQRNGAYADPIALWRQNAALTPSNPRPINALGYALFKAGRRDEAIAKLWEAIDLDPYYAGAYANLGNVYAAERNFAEAAKHYDKAFSISPDEFGVDFLCSYGTSLIETGRLDEAIKALKEAVDLDPNYLDARYNLGNAYLARGQYENAVATFREVISRNPRYAEAYVNLGLGLSALGKTREAVEAYSAVLPLLAQSRNADVEFKAHYNLALGLRSLGRMQEAREHFSQALAVKPDHAGARDALQSLPTP